MASLVWRTPEGDRQSIQLGERTLLGRSEDADCRLRGKGVSRRHACVEQREREYFVRDLGSTNGTFINDQRVRESKRLTTGDRIRIGELTFAFEETSATPSPSPGSGPARSQVTTTPLQSQAPTARKDAASKLPRRVGKFHLRELLGRGGMGEIYLARDLDTGDDVAVKLIRSQIGRRGAFLELFHNREAALARQVDHRNVVRIHEHGITGGQHFISMEYARGRNLQERLRQGALPLEDALEIVKQSARGLAAAHRHGVVHSDIKPSNILLCRTQRDAPDEDVAEQPAGDASASILEFDDETRPARPREEHDPALFEEIRRRLGSSPREAILQPPFFERAAEFRFLQHYLEQVRDGRGQVVLIHGDSGVGKDRLLSEFLERLRNDEATSARRSSPRLLDLDSARVEAVPGLFAELFPSRKREPIELAKKAEQLAEALLEAAAPVVLRVLGLESLEPLAAHFLARLFDGMAERPVYVVAVIADDATRKRRPLVEILSGARDFTHELYLRPLSEYQTERFLELVFRHAAPGARLATDVFRLSRGNFARILDVLRGFFDRRVLIVDERSGRLSYRPNATDVDLEEGKELHARYQDRSKPEQKTLERAAFIGPRFFFDTLLRWTDLDETTLFFVLKNLSSEGFVEEEGRSWFRFTNRSFQRYLAESFPESKRRGLHRKVARWLVAAPVEESAGLLLLRARHLHGGGDSPGAVRAYLEAARLARNDYRNDLVQAAFHEVLAIYRDLRRRDVERKAVQETLSNWFQREGNWFEILSRIASRETRPWVKIADFGISFRQIPTDDIDIDATGGQRMGTPRYMSPERVDGKPGGPPSDVFALGIVLYEMLVGRPHFPNLGRKALMQANLRRDIRLPREVAAKLPEKVVELFDAMVAKSPEERPGADAIVRRVTTLQYELGLGLE